MSARRKFLSRRFVGLFVDGITKIDDDRETEPDDVCDANSGGGMYGEKKYHTRYLLADNLFATHLTYRVLEAELLN